MAYQEDVNVNLNILAGAMGGVTAIMGSMSALTSTFSQMGTEAATAFGSVDAILVGATAMITAFGVEAANAFGEYEQGMKIVQAVSGQSSAAISELGNQANQLSVAYRTSIDDITEGLQTLGRAGLSSANEQVEVLESGLQTAKLEGRNLNGVLEEIIQNTAMLGGDLKSINFGEQADYLNSLMVGTSMTAPIDSHDISQTLQYAGGTAAAAGANLEDKAKLEDLMGTIAAFAQKGVSGSMAGTALRAFFTKPASQDNSVTEGLSMIGLSPYQLWEDGGESMKDVSDQIGIIQNQMDKLNLSTMDQVEIWGKIVGPKMGQQMMKLDADTIKDLTHDIQNAQSAEELSAETLQTYTQKISEFQQQGQVAFREFGEKVVRILTPVVEMGTMLMQAFSNPVINTAAFIALGSLVAHGISRAWGMLKAVYAEFKNLITEARTGITSINSLAGGSVSGFQQSTSQVEFLNNALHETDVTLQAIQARALGVKPGFLMPGGLATDKVPQDTLRMYDEDVIFDKYGVMSDNGKDKNKYYSGEKADIFKSKTKDKITELENEMKSAQDVFDNVRDTANTKLDELAGAREKKEQSITEEYDKRIAKTKEEGVERIRGMQQDYTDKRNLAPDKYTRDMLRDQERDDLSSMNDEVARKIDQLNREKDQRIAENLDYYDVEMQQVESALAEKTDEFFAAKSDKEGMLRDLRRSQKEGIGKLQTRLELNTIEAADAWFDNLVNKELNGTITPEEQYSLDRTRAEWEDKRNKKLLAEMEKEGMKPTFRSQAFQDPTPNGKLLAQIYSSGDFQDFAKAKNAQNANIVSVLTGRSVKSVEAEMNGLSKNTKSANQGLSNFSTRVRNAWDRSRRGSNWLKDNAVDVQGQMKDTLKNKTLDLEGKSFAVALQELSASVGLTAQEFAVLNSSTEALRATGLFTNEELAQLAISSAAIKTQFIEQIVPMDMEDAKRKEVIMALNASYDAIMKEVAARSSNAFGGAVGGTTSKMGKLSGAVSKVVDLLGGPLNAAIMGFTVAMEVAQEIQRQWQERMQEAEQKFSEAQDKLSTAEESVGKTLRDANESVSDAQVEQYIDYQIGAMQEAYNQGASTRYSDMAVKEFQSVGQPELTEEEKELQKQGHVVIPGEEHMNTLEESAETITVATGENQKALEDNTAALQAATYSYAQAEQSKQEVFQDPLLGWQGFWTKVSDQRQRTLDILSGKQEKGFIENGGPNLSASQQSDDYAGSKEFAGIFAAYMQDARIKEWGALDQTQKNVEDIDSSIIQTGLSSFFGSDYDTIISLMRTMDNKMMGSGYAAMQAYGRTFAAMDADTAAQAQILMKDNKSTFQKLGKQMFRYEQQYSFDPRRTAYGDYQTLKQGLKPTKGFGTLALGNKTKNTLSAKDLKSMTKNINKLTATDRNLLRTVNRIMNLSRSSNSKLTESNVLAMGSLQQLQDMYTVANEQVAPGIQQTVKGVFDTVAQTSTAAGNAGNASEGAFSASNNAAAIAAFLGAQASDTAYEKTYQAALENGDAGGFFGIGVQSKEEFIQNLNNNMDSKYDQYRTDYINTLRGAGLQVNHPDWTAQQIKDRATELTSDLMNKVNSGQTKLSDARNTVLKPLLDYTKGAVMAGYSASNVGEYGGGSSGGGGGGGGGGGSGGGGDSDSGNSGTRKERVDLVLCNKKEIPKLNVNLFKKPPNFTVLNKNFKLRDIKINSEDKPKAIMNAVKNGIIETQKRMDPKIIQDEEAEYNPVEATDGSSTPSGTTKTTT